MLLSELQPNYDYEKDGIYLIIKLWKKKNHYVEIATDWFDYNSGGKLEWLLVREYKPNSTQKKKYSNYKLKNIHEQVRVVKKIKKKKGKSLCM
ncbi:hypothetical protein IEE_05482 [Bacillus cereus BAG5X1-1]|uniref:Uncharacterized protein n=1 Tax=Bacillus cereus BAG5X1-1 TaxID=1053189 RepID=J7ZHV3_BACCE|nr:DUF5513 family protein [Bacillus cereus]EJQ36006.1 hypothetical protein IEE_05482 [Bacillus cereus BAG5X1-1]